MNPPSPAIGSTTTQAMLSAPMVDCRNLMVSSNLPDLRNGYE